MKKSNILIALILCFISLFVVTACDERSNACNESLVIDMFTQNGSYEDGNYYFRKRNTVGGVNFSYSFSYSPSYKMYNCNLLVTTYANVVLYDYASATFSWHGFKKGLFSAYHELDGIAEISFEYDNIKFIDYHGLGEDYNFSVISNTYKNLNNNDDIEKYASDCYDCLQQAVSYAQSILSEYNLPNNLW